MLETTDDAPGNVIELDAFAVLRRALKDGGGNGGGGNGGGPDDGDDPMRLPIDGRVLLNAIRQMAEFTSTAILASLDKGTDFSAKTAGRLADEIVAVRKDGVELSKQLHANTMRGFEQIAQLASASADRFEALEARIGALERALGQRKPADVGIGDDARGGP